MATPAFTRVVGLGDLKVKFAQLPTDISKKVLRRGASAGSRVLKAGIVAATPIAGRPHRKGASPGVARRAVITKFIREQSNDDQALFIVTYRQGKKQQKVGKSGINKDAFYIKWVERGHAIVARRKKVGINKRGRAVFAQTKRAARAAATARVAGLFFFARALRENSEKALQAQVSTMDAEIVKLVGR